MVPFSGISVDVDALIDEYKDDAPEYVESARLVVEWFIARAKAFDPYILVGESADGLLSASFSFERFRALGLEKSLILDFSFAF